MKGLKEHVEESSSTSALHLLIWASLGLLLGELVRVQQLLVSFLGSRSEETESPNAFAGTRASFKTGMIVCMKLPALKRRVLSEPINRWHGMRHGTYGVATTIMPYHILRRTYRVIE